MKSSNIPYLPQVDHLRALAAVWIVLYHGTQLLSARFRGQEFDSSQWQFTHNPLFALVMEGHAAVSLFMVLSGFIFTHGALGKTVRYGPFLMNRLLRIYPLYIVVGLWILSARSSAKVAVSIDSLIATLLPISDLKWVGVVEIVPMSWAVAVEFQFYLLFPFLLARFNDRPVRVAAGVIVTALVLRILAVANGANVRELSYWHLFGRIDQFVLGMLAAVAYARLSRRASQFALAAALPLTPLTLFVFHLAGGWPSEANWKVVWPTIEGAVWAVFVFGYVGAGPGRHGVASRLVTAIGEASFSIYLLHWLLMAPVGARLATLPWSTGDSWSDGLAATVLFVVPLTIAISLLTYRVIERPFLRMRVRYLDERPTPQRPVQ